MTRLLHRTAVASLLTANGICLAVLAPAAARTQPAGVLLDVVGAVVLCYVGTVALVHTCGLAWHLGRGDACRWRHRMQPTPGRRTPPATRAARAAEQQHAEAMAAVAAEPMHPQTADDTAAPPTVQTPPTFGFAPYRVEDAPPVAWTAPVAAVTGRHAGRGAVRDGLTQPLPVVEAGLWRPRTVGGGK